MAKPRRKNISREIRDIRFPTSHVPENPAAAERPVRRIRAIAAPQAEPVVRPPTTFPKRPLIVFACLVLVGLIGAGVLWYRTTVARAFRLQAALAQVFHLDGGAVPPGAAAASTSTAPVSVGDWMSTLENAFSSYGDLGQSSFQALGAVEQAANIAQDIPVMVLQKNGLGLIADLTQLQSDLKSIDGTLQTLNKTGSNGGSDNSDDSDGSSLLPDLSAYAAYEPDVARAENTVGALIALLQAPGQHHIIILFGNSAELRPGGGFLGSFADVAFSSSTINSITVHDINEIDRDFAPDIVPPKPLQGITTYWLPADANWFFDYPTSAAKVLQFMGESSLLRLEQCLQHRRGCKQRGRRPGRTRRCHPHLAQSDPGPAHGYRPHHACRRHVRTVTAATIIPMIQSEVEAGQASGGRRDPKQILSEIFCRRSEGPASRI